MKLSKGYYWLTNVVDLIHFLQGCTLLFIFNTIPNRNKIHIHLYKHLWKYTQVKYSLATGMKTIGKETGVCVDVIRNIFSFFAKGDDQ